MMVLCGCHLLPKGVPGSGKINVENREVGSFNEISFAGAGDLEIAVGPGNARCEIECDDNLLEYIQTEVVDGRLKIWTSRSISPTKGVYARIGAEKLSKLNISGSCETEITGLNEDSFEVTASGSGKIHCEGVAPSFKAVLVGSGSLESTDLQSENVALQISGSGSAGVQANKILKVQIAGSGDVRYVGSPEVHQSIAGSGSVQRIIENRAADK
jgi:hypothetical protein